MNTYTIYQLIHPETHVPFYVGFSQDPEARYLQHIRGGKVNKHLAHILNQLKQQELQPLLEIVETIQGSELEAKEVEKRWIQTYQAKGLFLANIAGKQRDKVTFYLNPGQLDKLEDMRIAYRKATKKRLNEQDFMRLIVDRLDLKFLL